MNHDSDYGELEYSSGELVRAEDPVARRPAARTGWLAGMAMLALVLVVGVVLLTPGLRSELLSWFSAGDGHVRVAPSLAAAEPLPEVPALWVKLDLDALPEEAVQALKQGKYYYDKSQPGNFGLAIDYWQRALAMTQGAKREAVRRLVASGEKELARRFSADSADVFVLLKQGRRDDAWALLATMRRDYLDVNAPQHVWASKLLYRRRS
ncbi:hypothetical protein FJY68_02640 [candidate division WOR-3 bacterium]|uniref:Uncharacterized protein n=1 Tax=candidate division WOR-3 bacterium TaxID=2052148 RepID=A0A938BSI9_UNCW3|nr:hypothetical protein [candidate division WOR-3 bacterium]